MLNPLLLSPILEFGKAILDRFVPDPEKKREAEMEMFRMAADGELKQVLAQLEINAREAQHPSIFVAGWRPFYGWTSGFAFLYSTVGMSFLNWLLALKGLPPLPEINMELMWVVVTGMLGIGGLRTFEKKRGVSK